MPRSTSTARPARPATSLRATRSAGARAEPPDARGTRERILDIALDLFVEKGYEKASLREIAEQLGFSKAALYYHFASKDDILLALHLRLHQLGREAFNRFEGTPGTAADWGAVLRDLVGTMLDNRKLLILHEQDRGALKEIGTRHPHDHADFEESFRRALENERMPLAERVRLVGAVGSIVAGLLAYAHSFPDVPADEYVAVLRDMVGDLLPA